MRRAALILIVAGLALALLRLQAARAAESLQEQIAHHLNLGKAFYENPTTHQQAVEEFKKALDLAPESARERVNYGLALLRAGKTEQGVAELQNAQRQDPKIPNTWFNLGIIYKKDSQYDRAIEQFEQMVRIVPDEPVSHYNLGYLYRLRGTSDLAVKEFETAERLDPNLAAPHFQLYNAYRQAGRPTDADRELKAYQEIKRRQANAVIREDMDWSYYAEIYDPTEPRGAPDLSDAAEVKFHDTKVASDFDPTTAGLAVLDADGDGRPDLIAWSSKGVFLFHNGTQVVEGSGLRDLKGVTFIAPGDFNNDGLPDLCVLTDSGAALYINERGRFRRSPIQLPEGHYTRAVWLDYDHDYDLDLFLLGDKPVLLRNNGSAGFSDQTASFPFITGNATDAVVFERVANSPGRDLLVSFANRVGVVYEDKLNGKFEAEDVKAVLAGTMGIAAQDLSNDGWTDVVFAHPDGFGLLLNSEGSLAEVRPSCERGCFGSEFVVGPNGSSEVPVDARPLTGSLAFADMANRGFVDLLAGEKFYRNAGLRQLMHEKSFLGNATPVVDVETNFSHRGKPDLAAILPDGTLHLYTNQTLSNNHWLEVGLTGVKNLKLAFGAEVEVKAGLVYRKQMYTGVPLLFGMGSATVADTVRITWPNGLIQNETNQAADKFVTYKEAQRLSGSCPMIFTWNGREFQFITDVLGVAPLGASSGDGQYFPVDHQEFIQIPGEALARNDNSYEIRITEELKEVSYLDQVQLLALDHPAATEVFTNEKFKSPPFPDFRLFGVRKRIYPIKARDDQGRDVLPSLLRRDATYPDSFRRDYSGVAEMHALELDFGAAASDNRAILVLNGWLDWADGSTYLAASQEGKGGLVLPYLQVKDVAGHWKTVIEDMGIPAGKPKTIVVDLTGKFLSASREIRIVTNLCLYWDEIFLSDNPETPEAKLTSLEMESAELRFRGFSRPTIDPERKQPESFDYQNWMPVSAWNPTPGLYTRYGEVAPLLRLVDDQSAIMGSGDEVRLLFSTATLPPLAAGWKRDFLLKVDGWAKDQDANTAYSQSVEPLPFHGMSAYPYPAIEHFPDDITHQRYRSEYNTRPALRLLRPLTESQQQSRTATVTPQSTQSVRSPKPRPL